MAIAVIPIVPRPTCAQGVTDKPAAVARAEDLEAQVRRLTASRAGYRRAIVLLRQAAALRPADDATALQSLELAARLSLFEGDLLQSRTILVHSAERASTTGYIAFAAHRWIDAAVVAALQPDTSAQRKYLSRARLLVRSRRLTAEERTEIELRLNSRHPTEARSPPG